MSGRGWWMLVLLPLFAPLAVRAQEQPVRTIAFEDPEVFCHILHQNNKQRLTALTAVEELSQDPAGTLLIIFGNPRHDNVRKALSQVREFQDKGGAVLLATDKPLRDTQLPIRILGTEINRSRAFGGTVRCPWLAVLTPEDQGETWDPKHPIFHLVLKGVATNCPSSVRMEDIEAPVRALLSFPPEANRGIGEKGALAHYVIGSPRDAPPAGRALYIAGHGVFMNGMLLQSETDNFRFALNVVDWLAEAPNGQRRTKALLIVDGTIVPDFDMKLTPPSMLPPIPMPPRAIINRLLRDLQEEGRLQQIFYDNIDLESSIAYALSFLVGGLLVYGAKKMLAGRQQVDSAAPRMVGKVAPTILAPTALKAQQIATLHHANLRREARQLVHAWLQREFGIEPERWRVAMNAQLRVQRYFWSLGATHGQADLVLRMARAAKPTHVSQREFLRVARALQYLNEAARAGRVTLLIDGKNVRKSA